MDALNHKKLYRQARTEDIKLKQALYQANKEIEKRDRAIIEVDARLRKLGVLLKAHDNSNTQSSRKLAAAKKRGGQLGHAGRTRKPEPTKFQNHG